VSVGLGCGMAIDPAHPGHFLKEWRKHAKKSQEELAAAMEIDRTAISKFETGKISPTVEQLRLAADYLGCSVGDLVAVDPSRPAPLWRKAQEIHPSAQEQAARILDTFPKKR
jgi:transcriptional regulator with XRE-family HTH domain